MTLSSESSVPAMKPDSKKTHNRKASHVGNAQSPGLAIRRHRVCLSRVTHGRAERGPQEKSSEQSWRLGWKGQDKPDEQKPTLSVGPELKSLCVSQDGMSLEDISVY